MLPYLKCLILVCIVYWTDSLHIEPNDGVMWVKSSRPLILTCISEWEVSWFKGTTFVKSNENVIIQKYSITTENREQHWIKMVINRAATTDSGNYSCTDGKEHIHIDVNVVKGQLKIHPSGRATAFVGESLSMTCLYEGGVKLNVTWYNDVSEQLTSHGFVSSRRTFSNQHVHTTLQSRKESLTLSDTGSYYCIAGPFIREIKLQVLTDICNERLISGASGISDDHITASSYYRDIIHDDSPHCARLNQTRSTCHGWSPIRANKKQWIQVSFSSFTVIRSIITLGRQGNDSRQEWVKSFRLKYSQDDVNWNKYKDTNGEILEFEANWDKHTEVTSKLPIPIVVKFLRIYPESWRNKISFRFDVLGCLLPTHLQITNEDGGKVNLFIPDTLQLTCNYSGPDKPDVVWYKNGVRLLDNSIFIKSYNTTWLKDRVRSTVTLKKEITTYGDSGVYSCVERTSRQNKTVTVHAAQLKMKPVFKRLWILTYTRLQMSCEYTGTHSKQITWNRNDGKQLQSLGFRVTITTKHETGTSRTTSTITKEKVSMNDSSNITCSGGDLERRVEVIIISGGVGRPQLLVSGQPTTLTCGVGEVDDRYSFEVYWTKNYIPLNLVESMKGRYKYSSNARLLTIHHADIQDAGHYECNILLEVGTDQQQHLTLPIELNAQPEIMIEGQTQIKSGDTLHLYCKVSGYPIPVIEWYKDGEVIVKDDTRANFLPYGDIPNGHLILFNVHDTDRGIYECKGSSVQFEPVKSSTFLKVKDEPVPQNVLLICVAVACTVVVLVVICCVSCIKCRSKQNYPVRNDIPLQNKPLLPTRYVHMQVITGRKSKSMTSLEEIDRLPPPPTPIDTWEDNSTLEDATLTYERIPRFREMQSV